MGRRRWWKRYLRYERERPRVVEIGFWDWLRWVLEQIFGDRDIGGRRS
jgi:hypothetical protein